MPKGVFKRTKPAHNFEDLTGQKHYRWLVLSRAENYRGKYSAWLCRCECGTERIVKSINFRTGTSKSCGCYAREASGKRLGRRNHKLRKPDAAFNAVYSRYRCQARIAGREFQLTKDDFHALTQQACFYCGDPPSNRQLSHAGQEFLYNGVDRADNDKGYLLSNARPCCHTCNAIKQEFTEELLFDKVRKIYKKHLEEI